MPGLMEKGSFLGKPKKVNTYHLMNFTPAPASTDLQTRLAAFLFFSGLSQKGRDEILQTAQPVNFDTATQLLSQGDLCRLLLLVERGGIRVHKESDCGKGITLYTVVPGEVCTLGVSSILAGVVYPAHATVDRGTDAVALPSTVFRRLFGKEEALRQYIMEVFSRRLGHLMMLVEDVAFRQVDERLASFIFDQSFAGHGIFHPVCMTHDQIAANLGTAREVVSRLLQQFAKEGLVNLGRGKILIANPQKLKQRCK